MLMYIHIYVYDLFIGRAYKLWSNWSKMTVYQGKVQKFSGYSGQEARCVS